MATYTRRFSAENRTFYYRKCRILVAEQYMGFDSQGHPSYFQVFINKPRVATREDLLLLQSRPYMKGDFFRDGATIYYYDMANTKVEIVRNSLFSFHTISWAVDKAKEIVDNKYA